MSLLECAFANAFVLAEASEGRDTSSIIQQRFHQRKLSGWVLFPTRLQQK